MKKRFAVCLIGLLAAAGCGTSGAGKEPGLTGLVRRTSGTGANAVEYWQDVDALSSASLLKAGPARFGYVDGEQGRYYMKVVDVNNPGELAAAAPVPGGHNVAAWTVNGAGKIAVVTADQYGRGDFRGRSIIIYDENLRQEMEFPFGTPAEGFHAETLGHREPGLAFTDKYAAVGWFEKKDDGSRGGTYITVHALADGTSGRIDTGVLGIGELSALAVEGDYIIAGGGAATTVCRITAGPDLAITQIAGTTTPSGAGGCHWIKSSRNYVLESVQGKGSVRVWKWNGADPPTVQGTVTFNGASTGSVQAMSFGVDDPDRAYIFGKASANRGQAFEVDLARVSGATAMTTPLFTKTTFGTESMGQMWILERARRGGDTWYVLAGGVGANENGPSGFLFLKNPAGEIADTAPEVTYSSFNWFWTLVRSARLLQNDRGDIFFVGKSHIAREAYDITPYRLRVQKIN